MTTLIPVPQPLAEKIMRGKYLGIKTIWERFLFLRGTVSGDEDYALLSFAIPSPEERLVACESEFTLLSVPRFLPGQFEWKTYNGWSFCVGNDHEGVLSALAKAPYWTLLSSYPLQLLPYLRFDDVSRMLNVCQADSLPTFNDLILAFAFDKMNTNQMMQTAEDATDRERNESVLFCVDRYEKPVTPCLFRVDWTQFTITIETLRRVAEDLYDEAGERARATDFAYVRFP